jgi:hypothetical protein
MRLVVFFWIFGWGWVDEGNGRMNKVIKCSSCSPSLVVVVASFLV